MKTRLSFQSLFLFFVLSLSFNSLSAQNIAINSTGSAPDASAMLDVQSGSKGVLIPQINLLSLTDATTITTPAHSLLVYNSGSNITKGYYYNSGTTGSPVWTKLFVSGTEWKLAGNTGTTPGTDFIGTTDAQALVLKTNNTSRVNISDAGVTTIGDGTNQLKIETDGTPVMEGTATVWDDMRVTMDKGTNSAALGFLPGTATGPEIYYFRDAQGVEAMSFSVQLPHSWKEGTTIFPHIHWTPKTTVALGQVVQWNFEYSWANYDPTPVAFPAITTSTVTVASPFTLGTHLITSLTGSNVGISATGKKVSSILVCRIWRNADVGNASDTYAGDCGALSLDFHFQMDTFGSRGEYTK